MSWIGLFSLSVIFLTLYDILRVDCVQFEQILQADGNGQRMPDVIKTALDTSLASCGVKCTHTPGCQSVSYHGPTRTCELSSNSGHDSGVVRVAAAGWTVYRTEVPYDCPNSVMAFVPVGSMRIKLCQTSVDQPTANASCSPFGRLAKIDTAAKISAVQEYLYSINSQEDVWINGYNHDLTADNFFFDDGTPVPPRDDLVFWYPGSTSGGDRCLRLRPSNYGIDDKYCVNVYHYMCELY